MRWVGLSTYVTYPLNLYCVNPQTCDTHVCEHTHNTEKDRKNVCACVLLAWWYQERGCVGMQVMDDCLTGCFTLT